MTKQPTAPAGNNRDSNQNERECNGDWIKLAQLAQTDFDGRRSLEWKLSLSIWATSAAFTYAILTNTERSQSVAQEIQGWSVVFWWALPIGLTTMHAMVIYFIQQSHAKLRSLFWYYLAKAENIEDPQKKRPYDAKGKRNSDPDERVIDWKRWGWFMYHTLLTFAVSYISLALVSDQGKPTGDQSQKITLDQFVVLEKDLEKLRMTIDGLRQDVGDLSQASGQLITLPQPDSPSALQEKPENPQNQPMDEPIDQSKDQS